MAVDYARINNTMGKFALYLENHKSVVCSVSGGSDSAIIVHIIATYFREYLPKIHFVFVNTGFEYAATKSYISELEQKYDIEIAKIRGISVVHAIKQYGVPILSKEFSEMAYYYIQGSEWAIKKVNGQHSRGKLLSKTEIELINAIKDRGVRVSARCCGVSKKKPMFAFLKSVNADLNITGERRAEGGQRAIVHKDCFEVAKTHPWDKYMPLFFWDDETKEYYKEHEGIKYSDCYEVWGFKRTGCVGCPFASNIAYEIETMKKYEPKLAKACINVFGESYRLMDEICKRPKKVFKEFDTQIRFEDMENDDERK